MTEKEASPHLCGRTKDILLFAAIALIVIATVYAVCDYSENSEAKIGDTFVVDNINYKVTKTDEVMVIEYDYSGDVVIPGSVQYGGNTYYPTSIDQYAFENCDEMKSLIIGDRIEKIGEKAFYYCRSITTITFPVNVTLIGENALEGCSSLTEIVVKDGNQNYVSENGVLFDVNKNRLIQYPIAKSGHEYSVPGTVAKIESDAFENCTDLVSVTIPDSVKEIGSFAFYSCTSLTHVELGSGIVTIYDSAFEACLLLVDVCNGSSLNISKGSTENGRVAYYAVNVYTPASGQSILKTQEMESPAYAIYYEYEGVTTLLTIVDHGTALSLPDKLGEKDYEIHGYALMDHSIESLYIPGNIVRIGDVAFGYCSLATVECDGITPVPLGEWVFLNSGNPKVYVPLEGHNAYIADEKWSVMDIRTVIQAPEAIEGLYYTGEEQTGVPDAAYGEYTITDNKATEVGIYYAKVTPNKGFYWSDGQQYSVNVCWTIMPHNVTFVDESGAKIAETASAGTGGLVAEPTISVLGSEEVAAGWYDGSKLWNFKTDKVVKELTLTLKKAKIVSGEVVIDDINKDAVNVALKDGVSEITAKLKDGSINVDVSGIKGHILISMSKNATDKDKVDIEVRNGNEEYTGVITVTLEYNKEKGQPTVYYYPEDGGKQRLGMIVDEDTSTVTFVTTHNSTYGIEYDVSSAGNDNAWLFAVIAMVLVLFAVTVGCIVYRHD